MDTLGRITRQEAWAFIRAAFWPAAILVGSLVLILGGSRYGFEGRDVIGPLLLMFFGAVAGGVTYQSVRDSPSSFQGAVFFFAITAGVLAAIMSAQTHCISGAGRGENAECFEEEGLDPEQARNSTELGLTFLIGVSGVGIGGAVLGRLHAPKRVKASWEP